MSAGLSSTISGGASRPLCRFLSFLTFLDLAFLFVGAGGAVDVDGTLFEAMGCERDSDGDCGISTGLP